MLCFFSHVYTGVQGMGGRAWHPVVREDEVSMGLTLVIG